MCARSSERVGGADEPVKTLEQDERAVIVRLQWGEQPLRAGGGIEQQCPVACLCDHVEVPAADVDRSRLAKGSHGEAAGLRERCGLQPEAEASEIVGGALVGR